MGQIKKILVIGSKGMAGHMIKNYLEDNTKYEVWGIARGTVIDQNTIELDITNTKQLEIIFNKKKFDIVVNCIGLLNEIAESNPELAIWYNSYFPHLLSKHANKYNFKLIHISTDCVFSGLDGSYKEDSFKDGKGFYAKSKSIGEIINDKHLTIRTSIIGPELKNNGIGLFHWFMNQDDRAGGYVNAIWSGITTIELAKSIKWAIKNDITSLYHVTNNKSISKCELLKLFSKYSNNKIKIYEVEGKHVDKSFIDTRKLIDYQIPDYDIMVKEMIEYLYLNKKKYHQYFI